jgi:hypothetical protein
MLFSNNFLTISTIHSEVLQFQSLDEMVTEFSAWGRAYYPAPVVFQFGYPADRAWWGEFADPANQIGGAILKNVPNTAGLYWVDFTVLEVFKS